MIDDRDERPGVKFKDSDLIGIPIRIIIGKHSTESLVEFKERNSNDIVKITIDDACSKILELVKHGR